MKTTIFFCIALFAIAFSASANAAGSTTTTWVTTTDTSISATFFANRCMQNNATQTIRITVLQFPSRTPDTDATVTAIVTEPDNDTNNIAFSNNGDGNYSFAYVFDKNGTYKFSVHANHALIGTTDLNDYVYVADFNINISFLNNNASYNSGSTATIRNRVTNSDNNSFNDLNGTTTINYPNNSVFQQNQAMTTVGNGEYIYTFTAPSTTGTYSATSSFTCGNKTDSNNQGRFIVASSGIVCGNGSCETGENCSSCSADCGSCPSSPGGSGGGGGGGSGAGIVTIIEQKESDAKILSWGTDKKISIGDSASLKIKILNNGKKTEGYLVSAIITAGKEIVYSAIEPALGVASGQTKEIVLAEKFRPSLAGTQLVKIQVYSIDKKSLYDELIESFDIEGTMRYDVSIDCLNAVATRASELSASILLANLGNYYRDVSLSWWVENQDSNVLKKNSMPIALYADESRTIVRSFFIPADAEPGEYYFKAEVEYGSEKRQGTCSFFVELESEYYPKKIEAFERQLSSLKKLVEKDKEAGYLTKEIEQKISDAERKMTEVHIKMEAGEYSALSLEFRALEEQLNALVETERTLEKGRTFMEFPIREIIWLIAIVLSLTALYLLGKFASRFESKVELAEKLLGLEFKEEGKKFSWKKTKENGSNALEKFFGLK